MFFFRITEVLITRDKTYSNTIMRAPVTFAIDFWNIGCTEMAEWTSSMEWMKFVKSTKSATVTSTRSKTDNRTKAWIHIKKKPKKNQVAKEETVTRVPVDVDNLLFRQTSAKSGLAIFLPDNCCPHCYIPLKREEL